MGHGASTIIYTNAIRSVDDDTYYCKRLIRAANSMTRAARVTHEPARLTWDYRVIIVNIITTNSIFMCACAPPKVNATDDKDASWETYVCVEVPML